MSVETCDLLVVGRAHTALEGLVEDGDGVTCVRCAARPSTPRGPDAAPARRHRRPDAHAVADVRRRCGDLLQVQHRDRVAVPGVDLAPPAAHLARWTPPPSARVGETPRGGHRPS